MPSDLPDGKMTDLFGLDRAHASPSLQPEKAKHQAMNATSGPNGSDLSELADRQQSLANRLKRQLDGAGSTLFTLTWKRKATPLGRPYYRLAASGLRTSDNDCGSQQGWGTPLGQHANGEPEQFLERKRKAVAKGSSMGICLSDLQMQAKLASWPTPTLHDAERGGQEKRAMGETRHGSNLQDFALLVPGPQILAANHSPHGQTRDAGETGDSNGRAGVVSGSADGIMGHASGERLEGQRRLCAGQEQGKQPLSFAAPSGANNPWSDLIWLPCTDGKQRPTQSLIQPLAHGVPARVAKLRAIGNAIVPQICAEFIKATM